MRFGGLQPPHLVLTNQRARPKSSRQYPTCRDTANDWSGSTGNEREACPCLPRTAQYRLITLNALPAHPLSSAFPCGRLRMPLDEQSRNRHSSERKPCHSASGTPFTRSTELPPTPPNCQISRSVLVKCRIVVLDTTQSNLPARRG